MTVRIPHGSTGGDPERGREQQLIAEASEGNAAAFEVLVRRHQPDAYGLAVRLLSDPHLAADVTQEALIRAWRALPRFRGDSSFGTWLHRITVNAAWSARRKADRHRADELDPGVAGLDPGDPDHPERAGERTELRRQLRVALDRLPAGSRAVVVLKDVEGWSHAEIAEALGISVTAAKVRLHRARLRLQDELEELR